MHKFESNGIEIAYEVHGDLSSPAVVGVMGLVEGAKLWPAPLVDVVVEAGFCFVGFDNRDIGLSTHMSRAGPPDVAAARDALARGVLPKVPYTLHDLAADTVALIDGLGIGPVHLIGYSMGGYVAQSVAARHPDRTRSLLALMTSSRDPALSPLPDHVRDATVGLTEHVDQATTTQRLMELEGMTSGSRYPTSLRERRAFADTVMATNFDPDAVGRQLLAIFGTEPFAEELARISVPTTVAHSTEDCFFEIDHGEDLARRIPGARLEVLEGAGHNFAESLMPKLSRIVVEHLLRTPPHPGLRTPPHPTG